MLRTLKCLPLIFLSVAAQGEQQISESVSLAPFVQGGFSFNDKAGSRGSFFRLGSVIQVNDNLGVGAAYSTLQLNKMNHALDVFIQPQLKLSDKASLYTELGFSYNDYQNYSFVGGVGVNYRLSPKTSLNMGYGYYSDPFDINEPHYTFHTGFSFLFGNENKPTLKHEVRNNQYSDVNPVRSEEQLLVTENNNVLVPEINDHIYEKDNACLWKGRKIKHTVLEGEWLALIARTHCTTVPSLLSKNPWIKKRDDKYYRIYPGEVLII